MRYTKYIAPFIFSFTSLSAFANGFYIGVGGGPEAANFNQTATIVVQPPGQPTNVKDSTSFSGTGLFGTIFGGYQWQIQRLYLAGEINANTSNVEFKSSNSEYVNNTFTETKYKLQHCYGLSILPGLLYSDATLFFFRFGYSNQNFKITTNDSSLTNINRNLKGWRYGIGLKESLTQHFAARLEFDYASYNSAQFTVITGPATKTTQITPTTIQAELSVIYNFG